MQRLLSLTQLVLATVLAVAFLAIAVLMLSPSQSLGPIPARAAVGGGSMGSVDPLGSMIFTRSAPAVLTPGQQIVFNPQGANGANLGATVHVFLGYELNNPDRLITRGVANAANDSFVVTRADVQSVVVGDVPWLGYVMDFRMFDLGGGQLAFIGFLLMVLWMIFIPRNKSASARQSEVSASAETLEMPLPEMPLASRT